VLDKNCIDALGHQSLERAADPELSPCPSCGKREGEFKDGGSAGSATSAGPAPQAPQLGVYRVERKRTLH
jgi:hypothetical protein